MKAKFVHLNAHLDLKWKTDLDKEAITANLQDREWERVDDDDGKR